MIVPDAAAARGRARAAVAGVAVLLAIAAAGTVFAMRGEPRSAAPEPRPQPSAAPSPTRSPEHVVVSVPWLSGPVQPEPSPRPGWPGFPDGAPCSGAAVEGRIQPRANRHGRTSYLIVLTNVGDAPCAADGFPPGVRAVRADGTGDVVASRGVFDLLGYRGIDLPPRAYAHLVVETESGCGAPPRTYPKLVVTMPGGGSVELAGSFDVACGLAYGQLGVPPEFWPPTPSRYAHITAEIAAPPVAPAGSVLRYHVTLTSSRDVRLDPCPSYRQSAQGRALLREYHLLNCAGTGGQLKAGVPVRFEMRIRLPDEPERTVTLDWRLQNEPGVQAEVRLTVP